MPPSGLPDSRPPGRRPAHARPPDRSPAQPNPQRRAGPGPRPRLDPGPEGRRPPARPARGRPGPTGWGAWRRLRGRLPGSSRAAAASVQPAGYRPADPPPSTVAASPAEPELRRARRRIAVAGVATSALVLAGGGAALWLTRPHYVDTAAVGRTVGAELSTRLGQRVLVHCDGSPRRRAGETFRCTATDAAGTRRTVTVTLLDDAGRYHWQLGA